MSILNVNKINPVGGGSTVTIAGIASVTNNISVGNSVTASSFHGDQIKLGDNKKILLGEGNDIEIYHTGSVDMIESKSLYLIQEAQNHIFRNLAGDEFYAKFFGNGSVELYHDNTKRIETTSSGITVSGTSTADAFIPSQGQLSHRNLIINGAMTIAQRSTSITQSSGYGSVDRIIFDYGGIGAHIPQAQVDVSSGTTPYTLGFRKAFKITNGNQGSSLPTAGYISIIYKIEAQDIATSGWNYKSASSYVTLSFWVKASVAQNYYFRFQTKDGTSYNYPMETGSLTANTWTKITKTIPGNSNLQIDNDNGEGPKIEWATAWGTDSTSSSVNLNQWAAYSDGTKTPDQTTTWYTTNNATFEITGVQLEVGSVATPFEHRSYGEELFRCQRYYQKQQNVTNQPFGVGNIDGSNQGQLHVKLTTTMRDRPTLETTGSAGDYGLRVRTTQTCTAVPVLPSSTAFTDSVFLEIPRSGHGFSDGQACFCVAINNNAFLAFNAEL